MAKADLTAQRLRELFDYNSETGLFTRLTSRGGFFAGEVLGEKPNHENGYFRIAIDQRNYFGHRLAWLHHFGEWPRQEIDHIDGNRMNNCIANLRDVPRAVNAQNLKRAKSNNKSSGLLGVTKHADGGFQARAKLAKTFYSFGLYDTPEEAHQAYLAAKRLIHPGCTI